MFRQAKAAQARHEAKEAAQATLAKQTARNGPYLLRCLECLFAGLRLRLTPPYAG
jgi:hypothetical protein